jgi:hypothetical protein
MLAACRTAVQETTRRIDAARTGLERAEAALLELSA